MSNIIKEGNMRKMAVLLVGLMIVWGLSGCGKNSALEGKIVNGKGQPMAGIKVAAKQVQPIKGYEQFETTTGSDGGFRFGKLFPTSEYELITFSEGGTEAKRVKIESGPEGQTKMLPQPMILRYMVSKEGVISDSRTGLEWLAGPGQDTNWNMARNWTAGLSVAGGGWRMPTRGELKTLYEKGMGERNIDPIFKMTGTDVWSGEPYDSSFAWYFDFRIGSERWFTRSLASDVRTFAVRSRG
jgi:hypothetical protein